MHPNADNRGFSLIELLVALAISTLILGVVVSVFNTQRDSYNVQSAVTEMVQTSRAAMDLMTREIRMAGYDPSDTALSGLTVSTNTIQVLADLDGDGDTSDADESITYRYDPSSLEIDRDTDGQSHVLAENIESFSFTCYADDGTETTTASEIRQVQLSLTARTSRPDPDFTDNGGYRTYTLTSAITPKNLGYN